MQRTSFWKIFRYTLGNLIGVNIVFTLLTFGGLALLNHVAVKIALFVFGLIVLCAPMYLFAQRDGQRERNLVKYNHVDGLIKNRYLKIGFLVYLLPFLTCLLLIMSKVGIVGFDFVIPFRIINGLVYPLSLVFWTGSTVAEMPMYLPFLAMLCYLPFPFFMELGFRNGYKGVEIMTKIIYRDQK